MPEKACTQCGQTKPLTVEFFPFRRNKNRFDSWCRDCYAAKTRGWNALKPEQRRSSAQAYRERTLETRRDYARKYGKEYSKRDAVKEARRKHHQMLKRNCLAAYAKGREIACECCNENILDFLTLDHSRNDGKNHRDSLGGRKNGPRFYKHLQDNGYPQDLGLVIMCMNCNWARNWSPDKCCPHYSLAKELTALAEVPSAYQAPQRHSFKE